MNFIQGAASATADIRGIVLSVDHDQNQSCASRAVVDNSQNRSNDIKNTVCKVARDRRKMRVALNVQNKKPLADVTNGKCFSVCSSLMYNIIFLNGSDGLINVFILSTSS